VAIIVHHLENSRSQRIVWLLEELKLPFEIRHYKRSRIMAAPPELKRVHPLGKSPIIEDEDCVVAETGAIVEYLVEKADGHLGAPASREDALRYRYYVHYAEGSLMTALLMNVTLSLIPLLGQLAQRPLRRLINTHLDFVESELSKRTWFAGETFTAADVMMGFPLEVAATRVRGLERRPATAAWLSAIRARPAYRDALRVGGPNSLESAR
jgi:glutathione S-transferase